MEGISKKAIATSRLFRFLIGPDQQEFTIHSALVAHQSPVLEALVNGNFKEAADRAVRWDDIDEYTFVSFWQYAYTGDYDTPRTESSVKTKANDQTEPEGEPVDARTLEELPPEPPEATWAEEAPPPPADEVADEEVPADDVPAEDIWGRPRILSTRNRKKKAKNRKRGLLWDSFCTSWQVDLSVYGPYALEDVGDNAETLVHHAKVYIFADRYGIPRLMDISLSKLHRGLMWYTVKEDKLHDIIALLRHCYGELVPGRLRDLVVHYAACEVEQLWKSEDFQDFLEANGNFSRGLIGSMLSRLD